MTRETPLGGFEGRLLTELRREIVGRSDGSPAAEARPPREWRRRLVAAGGVAAVLAVAIAAGLPLPGDGDGTRAYAVTRNDDGSVTVEVSSLEDADGLERELRNAGIPAVVQYVPPGKTCKGQTFGPAPSGAGRMSMEMHAGGSLRFTLDRSSVGPGQTLVLSTQRASLPGQGAASSIGVSLAQGDVERCALVDAQPGDLLPAPAPAPAGAEVGLEQRD